MIQSDSIINPRNMASLYTGWLISLVISCAIIGLAYAIQYTTPYIAGKSSATWITMVSLGGVFFILAVLFKYIFKREFIAWFFCALIGVAGLVCMLVYGWVWVFVIFFGVNLFGLAVLGPYLYFD